MPDPEKKKETVTMEINFEAWFRLEVPNDDKVYEHLRDRIKKMLNDVRKDGVGVHSFKLVEWWECRYPEPIGRMVNETEAA